MSLNNIYVLTAFFYYWITSLVIFNGQYNGAPFWSRCYITFFVLGISCFLNLKYFSLIDTSQTPADKNKKMFLMLIIFFVVAVLLAENNKLTSGFENIVLVISVSSFVFYKDWIKKILLLVTFTGVNLSLLMSNSINYFLISLYFISLFIYLFCSANNKLRELYGNFRKKIQKNDIRHFIVWFTVLLIIFLPFLLLTSDNGLPVKKQITKQKNADIKKSTEVSPIIRLALSVIILFFIAVLVNRYLLKRKLKVNLKEFIEEGLSQQGFVKELHVKKKNKYYFPKGRPGRILILYDRLISRFEKKLKQKLITLSPLERKKLILEKTGAGKDNLEQITSLFLKVRYGNTPLTDSEFFLFEDLYNDL